MSETKVLWIYGEDEYHALDFDHSDHTVQDIVELVEDSDEDRIMIETEDSYYYAELYVFEKIDPGFIEFINNNVVDYDMSKHENFYIVTD